MEMSPTKSLETLAKSEAKGIDGIGLDVIDEMLKEARCNLDNYIISRYAIPIRNEEGYIDTGTTLFDALSLYGVLNYYFEKSMPKGSYQKARLLTNLDLNSEFAKEHMNRIKQILIGHGATLCEYRKNDTDDYWRRFEEKVLSGKETPLFADNLDDAEEKLLDPTTDFRKLQGLANQIMGVGRAHTIYFALQDLRGEKRSWPCLH